MTISQTSHLQALHSSFSFPSSLTLENDLDPDDILERITHIKAAIKQQEELLAYYLDALDNLVENGQIDSDLSWNDWHIYRQPGRKTYTFPQSIKDQEADLRQSKELAIALGDATVKIGKPFWTIKYES